MNTTIYNARDVLECFFFQFDFGLKNALKKRSVKGEYRPRISYRRQREDRSSSNNNSTLLIKRKREYAPSGRVGSRASVRKAV